MTERCYESMTGSLISEEFLAAMQPLIEDRRGVSGVFHPEVRSAKAGKSDWGSRDLQPKL